MDWRKVTKFFILSALAIIAGYDIFVIAKSGTEASISMTLIDWSYKYPIMTFSAGVLCGHLFWRVKDNEITKTLGQ